MSWFGNVTVSGNRNDQTWPWHVMTLDMTLDSGDDMTLDMTLDGGDDESAKTYTPDPRAW